MNTAPGAATARARCASRPGPLGADQLPPRPAAPRRSCPRSPAPREDHLRIRPVRCTSRRAFTREVSSSQWRILQRYSEGQALGSEVTSFPMMVEAVRKVDKVRADVLEAGLKEIQDAPAAKRKALAKELLAKLQPSMK